MFEFDGECYVFDVVGIDEVLLFVVMKVVFGVLDWIVGLLMCGG